MKIAILGSVALPVPPPAQGGTEWIAYYQAKGLSDLGHQVILFAAKGSKKSLPAGRQENYELVEVGGGDTVAGSHQNIPNISQTGNAKRISECDKDTSGVTRRGSPDGGGIKEPVESSRNLRKENVYLAQVVQHLIDRKDDYDLIMNNMRGEAVFLPFARAWDKPFVNVMHLPIFPELAEIFKTYQTHVISISNAQRKDFPDLNYLATVYNCVDTEKYVPDVILSEAKNPQHDPRNGCGPSSASWRTQDDARSSYLLMMGSIAPHKNQAAAIRVAKKLGMKLVLAGKIGNQDYFNSIKDDIDGEQIKWFGELAFPDKLKLYQNAKVFLFPIQWEEPFGLVMIEAMSCGTPVVAFGNGAIPEVVVDGMTGFVIDGNSEEKMIEAVKNIDKIKREDCRKHVLENFTVEKMVADYETALLKTI